VSLSFASGSVSWVVQGSNIREALRLTPKLALSHGGVGVCWSEAFPAMTSKVILVGQARGEVTDARRRHAGSLCGSLSGPGLQQGCLRALCATGGMGGRLPTAR